MARKKKVVVPVVYFNRRDSRWHVVRRESKDIVQGATFATQREAHENAGLTGGSMDANYRPDEDTVGVEA